MIVNKWFQFIVTADFNMVDQKNVLVIGSGGREHALCWKLADSPFVRQIYCAPGSVGVSTTNKVESVDLDIKNYPVSF